MDLCGGGGVGGGCLSLSPQSIVLDMSKYKKIILKITMLKMANEMKSNLQKCILLAKRCAFKCHVPHGSILLPC